MNQPAHPTNPCLMCDEGLDVPECTCLNESEDYCLDHGDPTPCGSCGQGDIPEEDDRSGP